MTQEEIQSGNCLMAEFMGYVNITPTDRDFNIYENTTSPLVVNNKPRKLLETMSMEFHTSWDWLMPVVEKIEEVNRCPYRVVITSTLTYITDKSKHGTPEVIRAANTDKLTNTWVAVVEFIKWYKQNENSPNNNSHSNSV